ncbi:alpha-L-rhamnosidase-like protein [Pseudoduganella lurida]|uniref:Alpha-L-rhamnosidase-like protein n=1 Tax=Pseudoduganella lurida TaxID=1036180 RepID=A0A562RE65_9BURK|nr:glycosyl hydrolase [Pseudoduganella lurida]TWI67359.1 alpha-L-rhamnosidase-like protein [Pseudoduganella lurida]
MPHQPATHDGRLAAAMPASATSFPTSCTLRRTALAAALLSGLAQAAAPGPLVYDRLADVANHLATPPADARPMMRWWWFGPAVEKKQLAYEIGRMKEGGIGGVEIQTVYPMALDDPSRGVKNLPYLSPEYLDALRFANETARDAGLRVDLTLGSGWPFGGPHIGITDSIGKMRVVPVEIPAGAATYPLPTVTEGEKIEAAFLGDGNAKSYDATRLKPLQSKEVQNGRGGVTPAREARVAVYYIASHSGMQVKRPAVGGEGYVLDHMSRRAIDNHLKNVGEPLLKAFGDKPPYSIFSDSLEGYGSDWTADFLAEFQRRRGYDLRPYLPLVFSGKGDNAPALRHDWAQTQTELVEDNYLKPVTAWAKQHGTQFRSQTYGEPPVSLSSFRHQALFEGEGAQYRQFSFTRLASSAAHLYGRSVVSAETWTWLRSPAHTASPLDMKAEADRMFVQGVTQIIGHGWPYTPPNAPEPGYQLYAAAVFNHHQPWYMVMPEVSGYLARVSFLLRQGQPANQVAVFLPNDDVYAENRPGKTTLSGEMTNFVKPELIQQIMDAGHNLDYVDPEAVLEVGLARYPVLVMPNVRRLAPEVIAKLDAYEKAGGRIIAIGGTPSLAPGYRNADRITADVRRAAAKLFARGRNVQTVASEAELGAALQSALPGDIRVSDGQARVSFVRRKLADADIYFIANTSNQPVNASLTFRQPRANTVRIDPDDGRATQSDAAPALQLAPYESVVYVLSDAPLPGARPAVRSAPAAVLADLSSGWQLTFPGQKPATLAKLQSWTDNEATRYFSGQAVYRKQVTVKAPELAGRRVSLDFGTGTALPEASTHAHHTGMRAMYEPALRDVAIVTVNGQRAGALWHPPYRLDVTPYLKAGANDIEVKVGNLGVNTLAGRALPDFTLLNALYGKRFELQDTKNIAPQPAGLLGPVTLVGESVQ